MKSATNNLSSQKKGLDGFLEKLDKHEFWHFYLNWSNNRKLFKALGKKNVDKAVEMLVDGLGGVTNLLKAKGTVNSVEIRFKSSYLVKKDVVYESGGVGIIIEKDRFLGIFDYQESIFIVKEINRKIFEAKRNFIALDVD